MHGFISEKINSNVMKNHRNRCGADALGASLRIHHGEKAALSSSRSQK
jgi:hypothetical protein